MADGRFEGKNFIWPVRVYYEDTDAVGIVYYANYLKFAERARSEMLRALGVEQTAAMADAGVAFVVKRCEIEYITPARLDDELDVTLSINKVGAASMEGDQVISRDGQVLAELMLRIACIDHDGRPARMPASVRHKMNTLCQT